METTKPSYAQAERFSKEIRSVYPEQWFAYNLSPSFDWRASGFTSTQKREYIQELGRLGFVWQFITVGGFHTSGLAIDAFAKRFAETGMQAYCEMIQEPEREAGIETFTHQV